MLAKHYKNVRLRRLFRRYQFRNTKLPEVSFRALLTEGAQEVRFERVAVNYKSS